MPVTPVWLATVADVAAEGAATTVVEDGAAAYVIVGQVEISSILTVPFAGSEAAWMIANVPPLLYHLASTTTTPPPKALAALMAS